MGITLGDAILHLKADRSELESGLEGATGGITSWLGGIQSAITTGLVGAAVGAVMHGVRAAAEEETAFMKLEAVYRATGGAVGMTVDELKQLAEQLMFTTGIEHEQFIQAEAVAMTYGNISREVMPRLLTVAADMAALFDGDVVSSTRNVALALSAGEDGLMRLRRAGVIFTDEQREMISTMMATGDAAGAQNIILTELESRFGGTAAANMDTFNGRLAALKSGIGELWEALGNLNIGGRTLISWMTDGITTATNLITIQDQIDTAFESTRDQVAQQQTTFQGYLRTELAVAVAAGKLNQSQADLILRFGANADMLQGPAHHAYERTLQDLNELGIVITTTDWGVLRAGLEDGAAAADDLSGRTWQEIHALDELHTETGHVSDGFAGIAERARNAFAAVDTALAGTIENFRTQAAWIAGGGLELQGAAQSIIGALQRGAITPEQADALFQPVEAAALGLQVDIGQITMPEATRTMASDWALNWGDARTQIQGARADILTIPATVRSEILVAVRYQLYGGGGPGKGGAGGQHGLSFDVEGPSGADKVPVNLALTRGEHVEVTPAGEQERGPKYPVTFNVYVNNRDDLQALEQSVMQIFRGV
jgi:hypothetical protein